MSKVGEKRAVSVRRRRRAKQGKAFMRRENLRLAAMDVGLSLNAMAAGSASAQTGIGYGGGGLSNATGWEFFYDEFSSGPTVWQSPNEAGDINYLFEQGWLINEKGSGLSETPLSLLSPNGGSIDGNTLTYEWQSFGESFSVGDLVFTESYELIDTGNATSSIVNTTLTVENLSTVAADLSVFFYSDYDINETDASRDYGTVGGASTLQAGETFGSNVALTGLSSGNSPGVALNTVAVDEQATIADIAFDGSETDGGSATPRSARPMSASSSNGTWAWAASAKPASPSRRP